MDDNANEGSSVLIARSPRSKCHGRTTGCTSSLTTPQRRRLSSTPGTPRASPSTPRRREPKSVQLPGNESGADTQITTLITTHHHKDHSGGNEKFVRSAAVPGCVEAERQLSLHQGIQAYGGSSQAPGTNKVVKDGQTFKIGQDIDVKWVEPYVMWMSTDDRCLHTPCHTQDSTCFFIEDKKTDQRGVFTG